MSAAPQLAPEGEQPPAQEAPVVAPLKEASREPETLREAESRLEQEGMAKVNELGKNLNLQAEAGAQEFTKETKSWWDRAKGMFGKKEGGASAPVKGEAEILAEIEKSNAAYADFKKKYQEIMAGGDQAGMRALEQDLSQTFDVLAEAVKKEGEDEAKQWKKATVGKEPPMTVVGAQLNDVTRRLAEVRGRLNGAPAPAETPAFAAPEAAPAPAAEAPQEMPQAEPTPEAAPAPAEPTKVESKADRDRSELEKASAGKPGEKMVGEYMKVRDIKSDKYGNIAARAFDPVKGEIRLTYEDGSQLRRYATGMVLRVYPGGKVEEIKPEAQIVEEPEEEVFDGAEKAQLLAGGERAQRIADMGKRVDAAIAAEDEASMSEGVVSGETESKPEPEPPSQEESVVISPEAHLSPALEKVTKEVDAFDFDDAKKDLLLNFRIDPEVGKRTVENWRNKRAEAADITGFKSVLAGAYDIPADEIDMIPASDLAAQHERFLSTFDRLIEAGEAEMRKAGTKTSEQAPVASGEIENRAVLQKSKSSAEASTASGEIDTEPAIPTTDDQIISSEPVGPTVMELEEPTAPEPSAEAPPFSVQPDAELESVPATPPAPEAAPAPEKKESSFDKLEAKMSDAAMEVMKMPEAAESPKTFPTKVGKLPADKFLEVFKAVGAVSETEAADLAAQFKVEPEEFDALRKKLASAVRKKMKG